MMRFVPNKLGSSVWRGVLPKPMTPLSRLFEVNQEGRLLIGSPTEKQLDPHPVVELAANMLILFVYLADVVFLCSFTRTLSC